MFLAGHGPLLVSQTRTVKGLYSSLRPFVVSAGGSLAVKIALAVKVAPADKVALADMVAPAVKVINGGTLAVVAIVVGPRPSAALDAAPVTP